MSDKTAASSENASASKTPVAPRARRVSSPRPKKVAKSAKTAVDPEPLLTVAPVQVVPQKALKRVQSESSRKVESASVENDWPEPDAASAGSQGPSEANKRKRRRRKGKGKSDGGQQSGVHPHEQINADHSDETQQTLVSAPRPAAVPQQIKAPQSQQSQNQRARVDPEMITKMAWKIYLAEISEEGIALIGDNDAKDLSRRCFRLAEIFTEEQSRRR
jgi:hypothetical protein